MNEGLSRLERRDRILEAAPEGVRQTKRRSGTCTCGAARPIPPASSIVSAMSAIRRRISGAVGSSTSSARWRRTGWPMRAIFRMAMAGTM